MYIAPCLPRPLLCEVIAIVYHRLRILIACGISVLLSGACQDHVFERRDHERADVVDVKAVITTLKPTDILFVIDNSGTMTEESQLLRNNMEQFISVLVQSGTDFQVGVVTTDVDCNVPDRLCPATPNAQPPPGKRWAQSQCCALRTGVTTGVPSSAPCTDQDVDQDGTLETSTCDGGRLRSANGVDRILRRPDPAATAAWIASFGDIVQQLDCIGSPIESGLEAARRAIVCSAAAASPNDTTLPACPDPAVAQLNAGFLRPEADLVIVLVSDEDDCSFATASSYGRPLNISDHTDIAAHLCSPSDCYAHYSPDTNHNGMADWIEDGTLRCVGSGGQPRGVLPPALADVDSIIDDLVAAKGGDITRIRAAAIVGAGPDSHAANGYRAAACYTGLSAPGYDCGCLASSTDDGLYCALTDTLGQLFDKVPVRFTASPLCHGEVTTSGQGCEAMPGSRYVQLLDRLSARRVAAGARADVLAGAICQPTYADTMLSMVQAIVLDRCFELAAVPTSADALRVMHNGTVLTHVEVGSAVPGWSWIPGSTSVCLEGGLHKAIGDSFDVQMNTTP